MRVHNSPITGKPMRVIYTPDSWNFRGEKYDFIYITFRDDESNEEFTTTESDTIWYNQATNYEKSTLCLNSISSNDCMHNRL